MELTLQREQDLIVLLSLYDLEATEEATSVGLHAVAANLHRRVYWRAGKKKVGVGAALQRLFYDGRVWKVGDRYFLIPAGEGALFGWARFAVRRRNKLQKSTSAAVVRMRQLVEQLESVPPCPNGVEAPAGHTVYVVLLAEDVLHREHVLRVNPDRDPSLPCVYVGMTGKAPEVRFYDHKRGHKSSRWVRRYGIRLWPEMIDTGPLPYEDTLREEARMAAFLRGEGWTVLARATSIRYGHGVN